MTTSRLAWVGWAAIAVVVVVAVSQRHGGNVDTTQPTVTDTTTAHVVLRPAISTPALPPMQTEPPYGPAEDDPRLNAIFSADKPAPGDTWHVVHCPDGVDARYSGYTAPPASICR